MPSRSSDAAPPPPPARSVSADLKNGGGGGGAAPSSPSSTVVSPAMATSMSASTSSAATNTAKEKKRRGLFAGVKSPFRFMGGGKVLCQACKKKCSGEVLRVNDLYFHNQCFSCAGCRKSLAHGGFFTRGKDYFCAKCYQSQFGTKCAGCQEFVEGEVVTALGKTYHQSCFTCGGCGKAFPMGERVTFTGKNCLCQECIKTHNNNKKATSTSKTTSPQKATTTNGEQKSAPAKSSSQKLQSLDDICASCGEELKDGQALMALDKQYHVWCFKCRACDALLHGEYMGKDGHPYCERDYQQQFGVKCTYCRRFISGKVLQAGDNNHFHPTCARCTKCGDPFGDGEEMFLQGAAIWHPRCGPGPDDSLGGMILNGFDSMNYSFSQNGQHQTQTVPQHFHHAPSASRGDQTDGASMASAPFYGSRASSPGASLRRGVTAGDPYYDSGRFSRSTMHVPGWASHYQSTSPSRLYSSNSTYSLRRPIEPGDRVDSLANINHFHIPAWRRPSVAASHYGGCPPSGRATPMMSPIHPSTENLGYRPISCPPPKPGYTQGRMATSALGSAISPGPGMHYNDFLEGGRASRLDDGISQQSFRTDYSELRPSSTYSHNLNRTYFPMRPQTPGPFTGEHKIYPLHTLFTSNYKMPPELDRCNLEKHLSDADFELAFNMCKEDFYRLPLWKRNNMKKRVKLF